MRCQKIQAEHEDDVMAEIEAMKQEQIKRLEEQAQRN